jgi:hypothetical protein
MASCGDVNVCFVEHAAKIGDCYALIFSAAFVATARGNTFGVGINRNKADLMAQMIFGAFDSVENICDAAAIYQIDNLTGDGDRQINWQIVAHLLGGKPAFDQVSAFECEV